MHLIPPDSEVEETPDTRPVWRREYDSIMERFDKSDRQFLAIQFEMAQVVAFCKAAADNSLKAHQTAQLALRMRSSWAPFLVSAMAFAMSFASLVLAIMVYGLVRR